MSIPRTVPERQVSAPWGRDSMTQDSFDGDSSDAESQAPQEIVPHPSPYRGCTAAAFADINSALATRSLRTSVYQGPTGSHPQTSYLARPAPQSTSRSSGTPESFPHAARTTYISSTSPYSNPETRPKPSERSKSLPRLLFRADHDASGGAPKRNHTVLKSWTARRFQRTSRQTEGSGEKDGYSSHKEGRVADGGNVQGLGKGSEHPGPVQDRKTRKRRAGTCIIM
ncbi:hypothetical protein BDV93DRAFT_518548 [Ceratobasidium sp. AG-I]|nr:hypothetical protein BDV93DRAFT_518548 [Ceratobasidium sp. AG-I]